MNGSLLSGTARPSAPAACGGGLYVHLPFCPYICPYCDFAKWPVRRSGAERYLAALAAEVRAAPPFAAKTLFFGGGTPNTYAPERIAELVALLRERFDLPEDAEATIEMNPDADLCSPRTFELYREAGITRVSFGVQSFVPAELATLGRRHNGEDVARAFAAARAAGISNLSLDLIFGAPGQTRATFAASLDAALALDPAHVSTYGLTIEDGTPYAQRYAQHPGDFPGDDAQAELYACAIDTLTGAGYEHYEISNFARPGRRCAHNAGYWQNGDYLGLGVGAASYLGGNRFVHSRDFEAYCAAVEGGRPVPGEDERLEGAAKLGEATMLSLRTAEGVDVAEFAQRYHVDFHAYYAKVLSELRATETLDVTPAHVRLTRRGRFVANDVCGAFVTFRG